MEKHQRDDLREKIEEMIDQTNRDVEAFSKLAAPIAPDNSIGRLSRMEAIAERSVNQKALDNAKIKLAQLEKALKQICDKEFGICIECEEPISIGRLQVVPYARTCIKCAQ